MAVAPAEPPAAPAAPPPAAPPAAAPAAPPAPPAPGLGNLPPAPDPAAPPAPPAPKTRPDWLGEKFWDATKGEPKVEDLAKAEAAWRAQISRGDHKPPATAADYKLDFSAHTDPEIKAAAAALIVPTEDGKPDPVMVAVQEAAHKAGVSQAGLQAVVETFLKAQASLLPPAFDEKAEMAKLGQHGPALVKNLQDFAAQELAHGKWTDDDAQRFRNYLYDAGDAMFLQKLLHDAGRIPEIQVAHLTQQLSTEDASTLDRELADIQARAKKGENVDALFQANLDKRAKLLGKDPQRSWPPPAA